MLGAQTVGSVEVFSAVTGGGVVVVVEEEEEVVIWVEVVASFVCEVMAAVRARERVHLLPLTVVIDCCGVAIRATSHEQTEW